MATRMRDRIFAMTLAILFFVFSGGLSFYVLWQLYQDRKEAKVVNDTSANAQKDQPQEKKVLKGTLLGNFTPVAQVDSLQVTDLVAGDGDEVKAGDYVTVDYTGALAATGVIFESSYDSGKPVNFSLDGVIQGWTDGIPGMKVGGTRRLLIPADQAYGANPRDGSGIPPNAPLVFDVTLKSIGKQ